MFFVLEKIISNNDNQLCNNSDFSFTTWGRIDRMSCIFFFFCSNSLNPTDVERQDRKHPFYGKGDADVRPVDVLGTAQENSEPVRRETLLSC